MMIQMTVPLMMVERQGKELIESSVSDNQLKMVS